jgi:hypothetical protein
MKSRQFHLSKTLQTILVLVSSQKHKVLLLKISYLWYFYITADLPIYNSQYISPFFASFCLTTNVK